MTQVPGDGPMLIVIWPPRRLIAPAVLLALVVAPPAQSQSTSPGSSPDAPRIGQAIVGGADPATAEVSTDELKQILLEQSALILDTRPHMEWATGHIPGALNVAPKPGMAMSLYTSDVAEIVRLTGGDTSRRLVLYCNGPFCGKSKRVAEDLLAAGFIEVRRYQLGAPVWRALGGVMEIEEDGLLYVAADDRTAVFVDARTPEKFDAGSAPGARNVPLAEVGAAKDDGRLPMQDHNTRIIVFGGTADEARAVAEEIARNAFHNVSYFRGTMEQVRDLILPSDFNE